MNTEITNKDTLPKPQSPTKLPSFYGLRPCDLFEICRRLQVSDNHVKKLLQLSYKKALQPGWPERTLPDALISHLQSNFSFTLPTLSQVHRSAYDDSVKFLLTLEDQSQIEMVLMPEANRITLCLSSQVGCRQACTFCHTGRMGLIRQLTTGDIIGQIVVANQWIRDNGQWLVDVRLPPFRRVTNVVFMGMGEPLDNLDNVIPALDIMTHRHGLDLTLRKITVSTAGHVDGLRHLYAAVPNVRIAISLHSPFDSERSRIMPINRRWPLSVLLDTLRHINGEQPHDIFIQYTLIEKVNDDEADAHELVRLLHGLKVKINLIPLNSIDPSRFVAPQRERIDAFRQILHLAGYRTMVRYSKGQDIQGACGQLVSFEQPQHL